MVEVPFVQRVKEEEEERVKRAASERLRKIPPPRPHPSLVEVAVHRVQFKLSVAVMVSSPSVMQYIPPPFPAVDVQFSTVPLSVTAEMLLRAIYIPPPPLPPPALHPDKDARAPTVIVSVFATSK